MNERAFHFSGQKPATNGVGIFRFEIPKGFRLPAQGCEERTALGQPSGTIINPNGVVSSWRLVRMGRNPVGVGNIFTISTKGARPAQPWALWQNPVGILDRCAQWQGGDSWP